MLVKSEDDGLTWSEPINITTQVKDSSWYLLLQGPGKGITLDDGTLVFPAQFKDHTQVPHSTLIFSRDHGTTWQVGNGVKPETTEAQIVQLINGEIMINARTNHAANKPGVGRVVATSNDLGQYWTEHSTSVSALEEPTCMASLVSEKFEYYGELLLFSNPDSYSGRFNLTIKASLDQGLTWPQDHWLLLDEGHGRGYSCLTKIDEETMGILYESSQADLVFQRIHISDIMGN
jgi:sialidase-1